MTQKSVCVLCCSLVFSYRLDSRLIKMSRLILKTTVSCTFYHFRAKITNWDFGRRLEKRVKVFSGSSNIPLGSLNGKEYGAVEYFPVL